MQPTFILCLNGIELQRSRSIFALSRVARILVRALDGVCAEIHGPPPIGGTATIHQVFTRGTLGWSARIRDKPLGVGEADELARAVMMGRPDLPALSLDEWIIENRGKLTRAERLAASAVRDAHPNFFTPDECA